MESKKISKYNISFIILTMVDIISIIAVVYCIFLVVTINGGTNGMDNLDIVIYGPMLIISVVICVALFSITTIVALKINKK